MAATDPKSVLKGGGLSAAKLNRVGERFSKSLGVLGIIEYEIGPVRLVDFVALMGRTGQLDEYAMPLLGNEPGLVTSLEV